MSDKVTEPLSEVVQILVRELSNKKQELKEAERKIDELQKRLDKTKRILSGLRQRLALICHPDRSKTSNPRIMAEINAAIDEALLW